MISSYGPWTMNMSDENPYPHTNRKVQIATQFDSINDAAKSPPKFSNDLDWSHVKFYRVVNGRPFLEHTGLLDLDGDVVTSSDGYEKDQFRIHWPITDDGKLDFTRQPEWEGIRMVTFSEERFKELPKIEEAPVSHPIVWRCMVIGWIVLAVCLVAWVTWRTW